MDKPLPFAVLEVLSGMKAERHTPLRRNQWEDWTQPLAAANLVKPGGRVVAILPASMRKKSFLPGWTCSWSGLISNEFDGTSVSVVMLKADRK